MTQSDGTIVLVGSAGAVLFSNDNGSSFRVIPTTGNRVYSGVAEAADGRLLLVGFGGYLLLTCNDAVPGVVMSESMNNADRIVRVRRRPPIAERLLFENRIPVIIIFALLTAFFAFQALKLEPDASFEKMIPTSHPYIQNYLDNKADLASLSNSIRIIVETTDGDIFDKDFQEALRLINDEVFYIPGVDRSGLQSIWTPNVRWNEVTEEGFRGGTVIPNAYDGSEESLEAAARQYSALGPGRPPGRQ